MQKSIKNRLKENPDKKYLIVYVLAGHGIQSAGRQVVLMNEFHKRTGFYKFWGIEGDIRDIARKYQNSFQIAFFACCREIWSQSAHSNCFGGTYEQAIQHFSQLDEAAKVLKEEEEKELDEIMVLKAKLKEAEAKIFELEQDA